MNQENNIVDRLKNLLGLKDDSELAEVLDVSRSTVSNWRNNRSEFPLKYALLLQDKYGVSLDWIYSGGDLEKLNYVREGEPVTYQVDELRGMRERLETLEGVVRQIGGEVFDLKSRSELLKSRCDALQDEVGILKSQD